MNVEVNVEFKTKNMIPNDPKLSGSIVLERGTHFLSKQIILHMALYAKMTGRKPLKYSHAETLLWNPWESKLYTVGARASGVEITLASEYYHDQDILILKPKQRLTVGEMIEQYNYFWKADPTKYQTGNFAAWITWLKFPFIGWTGRKGDKRTYCYELAARFADVIGRWPEGKSLDMVSIYDLYENENYEIYEI